MYPPKQPKIPYTKEAYEKLKNDKARLSTQRKEVLGRLQAAREMGDLSENGAYKYAKFEISSINRQLRQINFLLKSAQVTQSKGGSVVDFGSTVVLESSLGKRTFTIVSEHESDPAQNKLSMNGPLGSLLIGKTVGDTVVVHAPAGDIQYTIVEVR